jgi:polygalacturonase
MAAAPVEWTPERKAFHPEGWTEYNGRPMFTEDDIPSFIKDKETSFNGVAAATGASVTKEELLKEDSSRYKIVSITDPPYNATPGARDTDAAYANTRAIDKALRDVSDAGGGTVKIPKGEFSFYTIHLRSNANILLEDAGSIILGALPSEKYSYDPPELNRYVGLTDYGHAHFANSLIYGIDVHDVMIYGEGLISGCYYNEKTGYRFTTLSNGGSTTVKRRSDQDLPDASGSWLPTQAELAAIADYGATTRGGLEIFPDGSWKDEFPSLVKTANKAIALVKSQRIVLSGFDMLNVGHFAFISAGVDDCLIENIFVDSNRDGFDIDTVKNFTLRNCAVNTPTDDAIVVKASFGVQKMFKTENILIYNNVVSGYDGGSAMTGLFTQYSGAPGTGRFKIGTEATAGFDRITTVNLLSVHCMGFCVESVDGQPLTNVIGYNLRMDDITAGPIFVVAGDRARYPVTDKSANDTFLGPGKVRPESPTFDMWGGSGSEIYAIPNAPEYDKYPIQRYQPNIVDGEPKVNDANYAAIDGKYYLYKWNGSGYEADMTREIPEKDLGRYAIAVGAPDLATVKNLYFGNVKATNVSPLIPIGLYGMVNRPIENVTFDNIDVTYRGGLTLRHAVEQKNMPAAVPLSAPMDYMIPASVGFGYFGGYSYSVAGRGGNTPRMRQDESGKWREDPYNVPEPSAGSQYPEPTNYGTLPAYGMYARHVRGLKARNFKVAYEITDTRPGIVLDDVKDAVFSGLSVEGNKAVLVTHKYKRPVNWEYYPEEPYLEPTGVSVAGLEGLTVEEATVEAPQAGTPPDSLYTRLTDVTKDPNSGYTSQITDYPMTVHLPWIKGEGLVDRTVEAGDVVTITSVTAINPADYIEAGKTYPVSVRATQIPPGAVFRDGVFTWAIEDSVKPGVYKVTFLAEGGSLPVEKTINVTVASSDRPM